MRNLFAVLILGVLLFHAFGLSYAQESTVIPLATDSAATPTPKSMVYQLPYPGLLPDNPLYFLKTMRDRMVGFLISDPIKKTEFNLLQSNKRLQAGVFLLGQSPEKQDLVISTISKGQNYFEEALVSFDEAKQQGMTTSELSQKLFLAATKQLEILEGIQKKISKSQQKEFAKLLERAAKLEKKADANVPPMMKK